MLIEIAILQGGGGGGRNCKNIAPFISLVIKTLKYKTKAHNTLHILQ